MLSSSPHDTLFIHKFPSFNKTKPSRFLRIPSRIPTPSTINLFTNLFIKRNIATTKKRAVFMRNNFIIHKIQFNTRVLIKSLDDSHIYCVCGFAL